MSAPSSCRLRSQASSGTVAVLAIYVTPHNPALPSLLASPTIYWSRRYLGELDQIEEHHIVLFLWHRPLYGVGYPSLEALPVSVRQLRVLSRWLFERLSFSLLTEWCCSISFRELNNELISCPQYKAYTLLVPNTRRNGSSAHRAFPHCHIPKN
jgi:hypothetical protein